jgi:hypothetical protein
MDVRFDAWGLKVLVDPFCSSEALILIKHTLLALQAPISHKIGSPLRWPPHSSYFA